MNRSNAKIIIILETIIMLIMSITLGYAIGQTKREVYQKENELQELKKGIEQIKK